MPTYLILGMTYAFAAAVQPGPLQTYLISQTLSHGWRRTLPAAPTWQQRASPSAIAT